MTAVFPERLLRYRCPSCNTDLTGKPFTVDERARRCHGSWHTAEPIKATYLLAASLELERLAEGGDFGPLQPVSDLEEKGERDA